MSAWKTVKATAFASFVLAVPAAAADNISQDVPPADACMKTVNAMGASMGYKAETGADGKPVYRFVVRQNGLDYDAVCDAATGVVGDVSPRLSH
jgi:hypothetical protein